MSYKLSSNSANTLLAFLAGAALGGIVVALTTPKRGSELRNDLNRLGSKAKDQVADWVESASDAMEAFSATGSEMTDKAAGQIKVKAEELAGKGEHAWKDVKKAASQAGNDLKDGFTAAGKELRT